MMSDSLNARLCAVVSRLLMVETTEMDAHKTICKVRTCANKFLH